MTIFGGLWPELTIEHVQSYLVEADDEPLLWEAKGTELHTSEIRRQVCAFANGHEVGYLIIGATKAKGDKPKHGWTFEGVEFPDEPRTFITNVITDLERGVRPRPDFDVLSWEAPNGHLAVVRIAPTSTPPCLANGTVYERLPGKTQVVRDPLRLADLFARGDRARQGAQASADLAALAVMRDSLEGKAGVFEASMFAATPTDEVEPEDVKEAKHVRFAVGVAATGNPPNIAGRLFRQEFATEVWEQLRTRPQGGYERRPDAETWSQEALVWRHRLGGLVDAITIARAAWDGSAAVGEKVVAEDVYADTFVTDHIAPAWRIADGLVERLCGFGDVYVTVMVAGGKYPRRRQTPDIPRGYVIMRRGPLLPGVEDGHVASLGRELKRVLGRAEPEPDLMPEQEPTPEWEPS